MAVSELKAHSPLGGSGAHRWMVCSGSVYQSDGLTNDGEDYTREGQAAHVLAELCLSHGHEPWELIGHIITSDGKIYEDGDVPLEYNSGLLVTVTKEMADAVQYFLHIVNEWHPDRNQGNSWVERRFHCPGIHPDFYSMSDFSYFSEENVLHVYDYKHGAGIVVEVEKNPQCLYYAAGIIEDLMIWDTVTKVVLHIIQPRGWHHDGPHRTWEISPDDLDAWLFDECVPAMERTEVSRDTVAGEHCRFCPARGHQCPAIMETMEELQGLLMMASGTKGADALTNAQLGRIIELQSLSKIAFKAANTKAFQLLTNGKEVPGLKLVASRSNRKYKKGAETAAKKKFGKRMMSKPTFLSPAQLDALPEGKAFTARWAFKPKGSTTVAVEGDPRRRIKRDAKSLFKPIKKG